MKWPDGKPYYSLNQYYKDLFGTKTYKIALDIGVTCPNRDGTLDYRGCIFCSNSGSGDFAASAEGQPMLSDQITSAIDHLKSKHEGRQYVAYLQSYTNTYGDADYLMKVYQTIIDDDRICGLSVATRPDSLNEKLLEFLASLNRTKPVFIELGLQTVHDSTADYIRRCYTLSVFEEGLNRLKSYGLPVIVHLIAGLPGEDHAMFMESVQYLADVGIDGIKLQLLHVLKDTDLGQLYLKRPFDLLTLDQYSKMIVDAIAILPQSIVIHRITGDGNRETLLGPMWSLNKRHVLNTIHKRMANDNIWQGCSI